jgi:putative transposase
MPLKDKEILDAIESTLGSSRKGRRKVMVLVKKKFPHLTGSKIRRVYEQYGFALTKKLRRRMKDNKANPISIPFEENVEWAMDFMSDSLSGGRKIRTLNIIDHYNKKCLGIMINKSIPTKKVIEMLEWVISIYGKPKGIRTDNGPEFCSKEMQCWFKSNNINWVRIQKGKPQQNAIIERFNRTYREDILDANVFNTLQEIQELTYEWLKEYNSIRPHQSLNYQTPNEYVA